jgi:DNA-binding FrmR family transcriptional regulator
MSLNFRKKLMHNHIHLTVPDREFIVAAEQDAHENTHDDDHNHAHDNGHEDGHLHGHQHDHSESIRRLKTAEGHLRGVQRMLEQDVYCIDVIRQIQAVQAALDKISVSILNQHLNTCVITAVRGENPQDRERVLKEIAEVFETNTKI